MIPSASLQPRMEPQMVLHRIDNRLCGWRLAAHSVSGKKQVVHGKPSGPIPAEKSGKVEEEVYKAQPLIR